LKTVLFLFFHTRTCFVVPIPSAYKLLNGSGFWNLPVLC